MAMPGGEAKGSGEPASAKLVGTKSQGPHAAWRDLIVFRAAPRPRQELWLSIGAFLAVLVGWLIVAESGLDRKSVV